MLQGYTAGGCECIDDKLYVYKGVRILGLGGSMEYKFGGADHQYSERAMAKRVRKLRFKIMRNKGFDILVAHSPAYRINDSEDLPHTGFKCFRTLMEEYRPKYLSMAMCI